MTVNKTTQGNPESPDIRCGDMDCAGSLPGRSAAKTGAQRRRRLRIPAGMRIFGMPSPKRRRSRFGGIATAVQSLAAVQMVSGKGGQWN
jgi:hypothetical protein